MAGYATGTANEPEEEEKEENAEWNTKQRETNSIGGSHSWEKECAARERLERVGNLAGYATGLVNEPEEEEEKENAAGNHKHPARNPVGGSQGWENENAPTSAPSTLGINGRAAEIFIKQATTLPAEGNTPSAGTKAQALHRVLMGGNPILQDTVGGSNGMGRGTGTMAAPTAGRHQGEGRGSTGCSALTEAVKMFWPASITQEFSEKLLK